MEPTEHKAPTHFYQNVFLVGFLSAVVSIPIFILLYKFVPSIIIPFGKGFQIDHILLFLLIYVTAYYIILKFRIFILVFLVGYFIVITITNFSGIYTLNDIYSDYKQLLVSFSGGVVEKEKKVKKRLQNKEDVLIQSIDYRDEKVRNYAANIAVKHFQESAKFTKNTKWVQFFSVFKEVYSIWRYVYDPINEDYYANASESLQQIDSDGFLKGDCDDYTIFMAACIKAIGGEVRLVKTKVQGAYGTIGHIFPEVKMGTEDNVSEIIYLIKSIFFIEESRNKKVHYYIDHKGFVWLNFDYNDAYPGGKYQSDIRENVIAF